MFVSENIQRRLVEIIESEVTREKYNLLVKDYGCSVLECQNLPEKHHIFRKRGVQAQNKREKKAHWCFQLPLCRYHHVSSAKTAVHGCDYPFFIQNVLKMQELEALLMFWVEMIPDVENRLIKIPMIIEIMRTVYGKN